MKQLNYILFFIFFLTISGCDLFSTRTPENPDAARNSFNTPKTANIVIDNFISAVNEKSSDNFLSCFSDTSYGGNNYSFTPSAEALSKFPGLFDNWDKNSEYRVFKSMLSVLIQDKNPSLVFMNGDFDSILPDSAVYNTDYLLTLPILVSGFPTEYSGAMQLILKHDDNQLWSISRWIDISKNKDSSSVSWSTLKAKFTN
jgi:hypothetical protein